MPGTRDRRRHRTQESLILLGLQAVATAVHIVPTLIYSPNSAHSTVRIVAYLAHLGPVWVLAFGVTALGLGASLWWQRGIWLWHLLGAAMWVAYDAGLWVGVLSSVPHGTVFFPIVALVPVATHVILAASYNEDVVYLEERRR
jgi:hypothetical protein